MSEQSLFEMRDLSVSYRGKRVVDGLSMEVAPGRCLGVIGESGAGKSQAFLAMLGLSGAGAEVTGQASLRGESLLGQGAARLRGRRVSMVFQDPLTSLTPHMRVGDQVAEPLMIHQRLSRDRAMARASELLTRVQVSDVPRRLRQYPHQMSGGMRQRVMIAIALAAGPELLIADEPTTALDVSVQAQLLALLRQVVEERQIGLIVVSHDMGVIATLADDVAVMRSGRVVERGTVSRVLRSPSDDYTRQLIAAAPRLDLSKPASGARTTEPAKLVLDAQDLTVTHQLNSGPWRRPRALVAVEGLSLKVVAGEALGVVGESGCGKSTLARTLLRLQDATSGEISWQGRALGDLHGDELRAVRGELQMVFQDPVASLDPLQSVSEIVAEPLRALRPDLDATQRQSRVRETLAAVGLGAEFLGRRSRELSGGQCQRVAIARAMILSPKLLVCDEAVSSLDVSIQAQILALLAEFKRTRGTSLLFVSHNLAVVRQLCERVLVMYLGRVVESGPTDEVFHRPRHPYTRWLLRSVPQLDPDAARSQVASLTRVEDPPSAIERPQGCAFHTRCPWVQPRCIESRPGTEPVTETHEVACWRWREPADAANEK